jgi:hypothetical protein
MRVGGREQGATLGEGARPTQQVALQERDGGGDGALVI